MAEILALPDITMPDKPLGKVGLLGGKVLAAYLLQSVTTAWADGTTLFLMTEDVRRVSALIPDSPVDTETPSFTYNREIERYSARCGDIVIISGPAVSLHLSPELRGHGAPATSVTMTLPALLYSVGLVLLCALAGIASVADLCVEYSVMFSNGILQHTEGLIDGIIGEFSHATPEEADALTMFPSLLSLLLNSAPECREGAVYMFEGLCTARSSYMMLETPILEGMPSRDILRNIWWSNEDWPRIALYAAGEIASQSFFSLNLDSYTDSGSLAFQLFFYTLSAALRTFCYAMSRVFPRCDHFQDTVLWYDVITLSVNHTLMATQSQHLQDTVMALVSSKTANMFNAVASLEDESVIIGGRSRFDAFFSTRGHADINPEVDMFAILLCSLCSFEHIPSRLSENREYDMGRPGGYISSAIRGEVALADAFKCACSDPDAYPEHAQSRINTILFSATLGAHLKNAVGDR